MKKIVSISRFKTEMLTLIEEVARTQQHIIITKHNVPIAKLVPIQNKKQKDIALTKKLKKQTHILGDIISPIEVKWDVCNETSSTNSF